jgi:hypothetical protein
MRHLAIALALLVCAVPAFAADSIETIFDPSPGGQPDPNQPVWQPPSDAVVLYDNSQGTCNPTTTGLITHPNACPAPAVNDSRLQTGETTFGYGHAISANIRVADNFTIPAGGCWDIQAITFFAYQTGATSPTINNVNFQLWLGAPWAGGAIIYGDTSTNVLAGSTLAGIRRTNSTATCAGDRLIMANRTLCVAGPLPAGTYYIDWQSGGTLASGPWVPPITCLGGGATGDAQQFLSSTGAWAPITNGTTPAVGLPFILEGVDCGSTAVEPTTWGAIKNLY